MIKDQKLIHLLNIRSISHLFHVTDENNNLALISYNDFTPENNKELFRLWKSKNENGDESIPELYRGLVVDVKTGIIYAKSYPYTPEFIKKPSYFTKFLTRYKNYKLYEFVEGIIIRAYTYNNELHISTHRKLNFAEAKWYNNFLFIDQLRDACLNLKITIDELKNMLKDENKCFVLLLVHPENQLLNQSEVTATLYHLTTYVRIHNNLVEKDVNVNLPKQNSLSVEQAQNIINLNKCVVVSTNNFDVKFTPINYNNAKTIRGNDSDIVHRWYKLCETNMQDHLVNIVPVYLKAQLKNIDKLHKHRVKKLTSILVQLYVDKYENNIDVKVNFMVKNILEFINNFYLREVKRHKIIGENNEKIWGDINKNNKVLYRYIKYHIKNIKSTTLYKMFKDYKLFSE